jgi:hypothetical protein
VLLYWYLSGCRLAVGSILGLELSVKSTDSLRCEINEHGFKTTCNC